MIFTIKIIAVEHGMMTFITVEQDLEGNHL
jgi:hypothetical protein